MAQHKRKIQQRKSLMHLNKGASHAMIISKE